MANVRMTISIKKEHYEALKQLQATKGESIAFWLRQAIAAFLQRTSK